MEVTPRSGYSKRRFNGAQELEITPAGNAVDGSFLFAVCQ
jgi:hypothetical protein